jgi:hypothetical protein
VRRLFHSDLIPSMSTRTARVAAKWPFVALPGVTTVLVRK